MNKKALIFLALIFAAFGGWLARPALATVRCETQYAGEVCVRIGNLEVTKFVWDPERKEFVRNLDLTDHKFSPGEEVAFQLRIKNVGDATFGSVQVEDTLPSFLRLVSGDLSFQINDLEVGETETRDIKTKVVEVQELPEKQTLICDVNKVVAKAEGEEEQATTKVCVSKKILVVKALPKTGPESLSGALWFSLVTGLAGLALLVLGRR